MNEEVDGISLDELRRQWPDDAIGAMCGRILRRYLFSKSVHTAKGAECTAERAQAEAGANKCLATLQIEFAQLGKTQKPPTEHKPTITPLARFSKTVGEPSETPQ